MIKVTIVETANVLLTNKNIELIKLLGQDRDYSTRLSYAIKKIREVWMIIVNTAYNTTEDMNNKVNELKGKAKLNFYKSRSNYYDEMKHKNFHTQEDTFAKNVQGISKTYHEVLLLMIFLQTKPQVKNMNFNYYDFYYTVNKN